MKMLYNGTVSIATGVILLIIQIVSNCHIYPGYNRKWTYIIKDTCRFSLDLKSEDLATLYVLSINLLDQSVDWFLLFDT